MQTARLKARVSALALLSASMLGIAPLAAAQEPAKGSAEVTTLGSYSGSGRGVGLALGARLHLRGGAQLGFAVTGHALRVAYLSGRTATGAVAGEATLLALLPLFHAGQLELDLRVATGLRYLRDVDALDTSHDHALRSATELGWLAHVRLDRQHLLRTGVLIALELETAPSVALADQMQLLTLGLGRALTPSLAVMAGVEAGGSYGFDGDNGKAVLRGSVTLRIAFAGDALAAF